MYSNNGIAILTVLKAHIREAIMYQVTSTMAMSKRPEITDVLKSIIQTAQKIRNWSMLHQLVLILISRRG